MSDVYCNKCHYHDESEYSGTLCCHYSNVKINKTPTGIYYNKVNISNADLNYNNDCRNYKGYNVLSSLFGDGCAYICDYTFIIFNIVIFVFSFAMVVGAACNETNSALPFIGWITVVVFLIIYYINNLKKYNKKIRQHNSQFTPEDPIWDEIASHMNPSSSPKAEEVINLLDKVDDIVDRRESHV